MPSSMCWPVGFGAQVSRRGRVVDDGGGILGEDADAVDPAAEARRHGHVRRGGHDARPERRVPRERDEGVAEGLLGAGPRRDADRRPRVRARRASEPSVGARVVDVPQSRRRARRTAALPVSRRRTAPTVGSGPHQGACRGPSICSAESIAEWLIASPGEGQPPALDRVGEDDRWSGSVGVGLVEGPDEPIDVVAAEVGQGVAAGPRRRRPAMTRARASRSAGLAPSSETFPAAEPSRRMRTWYSSLGMSSIRRWRTSPPGAAMRRLSRWPYLASSTCQPAAANMPDSWWTRIPGTTRSRLCRLRSTIIVTLPIPRSESSIALSQTLPSSSSASPTSETNRRSRPDADPPGPCSDPRRGARGTGRRAPRTAARPPRDRPIRSRSRPGRGPWCGSGTTAGRRTRAAR